MANVTVTRIRGNANVNVNQARLVDIQDKMVDAFTVSEPHDAAVTADNIYLAWVRDSRWFAAGANIFFATFNVRIDDARNQVGTSWDNTQVAFLGMFSEQRALLELDAIDLDGVNEMALRDSGKTPDQAAAKFRAAFAGDRRPKVIALLANCYTSGLYAPIGSLSKKGVFNDKNLLKFVSLTGINMSQKELIAGVFKILEIGAKGGFSLNHYIKALYRDHIVEEANLVANKGLIDYYFFSRGADSRAYWMKYAAHYHKTIEQINASGRTRGVTMSHKRDSDMQFDVICSPDLTDVGEAAQDLPWELLRSDNYHTICYFDALCMGYSRVETSQDELAGTVIESIKALLGGADRDTCLAGVRRFAALKTNEPFWRRIKARAKGVKLALPAAIFTAEEVRVARGFGISFKGDVPAAV